MAKQKSGSTSGKKETAKKQNDRKAKSASKLTSKHVNAVPAKAKKNVTPRKGTSATTEKRLEAAMLRFNKSVDALLSVTADKKINGSVTAFCVKHGSLTGCVAPNVAWQAIIAHKTSCTGMCNTKPCSPK